MLKQKLWDSGQKIYTPAAFRRLCVETFKKRGVKTYLKPAAFRRLCVETVFAVLSLPEFLSQPPSGGCVLKLDCLALNLDAEHPAAFRRLCVETTE